jgi:hypothetical protein
MTLKKMNLKKIKNEDKDRILYLYLNRIGDCNNCGDCQACAYKYIINNLRNKSFTLTTKTGVVREMPSFENMESFGYTLLQTPLESLIISYPISGLKEAIDAIPQIAPETDYSPSFSETIQEEPNIAEVKDDVVEEDPNYINSEIIEEQFINDKSSTPYLKSPSLTNFADNTAPTSVISNKKILIDSDDDEESIESNKFGGDESSNNTSENMPRIDPHQLTGRKGLDRMMSYVDSKSPAVKGDFEYRPSTLQNYGKIFSQNIIGKYSSKIKNICENISFTNEAGQVIVSDGIILIYSKDRLFELFLILYTQISF